MHPARLLSTALLALTVTACGSSVTVTDLPEDVGPPSADATIRVDDNRFEPAELVVEVDTPVTWVWEGRIVHDVAGDRFRSSVQVEGDFTHTFDQIGSHAYVCTLHPGMQGVVHVIEATP